MKISASKKQLAKIISENGGWREGAEWSSQDRFSWGCSNRIVFYTEMPQTPKGEQQYWSGEDMGHRTSVCVDELLPKWSETILSRDEYFHLYPAQGAISPMDFGVVDDFGRRYGSKPTIEQLAAEYRNLQGYAERKQQEADEAKAEAAAKLSEMVAAGKAVGLEIFVAKEANNA